MRLIRVEASAGPRLAAAVEGMAIEARVEGGGVVLRESIGAVNDLRHLPVVAPSKIIAVGLNYPVHAEEAGAMVPSSPLTFAKYPSAVVGDRAPIRIPAGVREVDYEAELGVVIGREARDVSLDSALEFVLGYTCVNDVSARDVHLPEGQWTRGKSFDTFCPVGPCLVTTDDIHDPQSLAIQASVDGEIRQSDSTASMVFSVAELIAFISRDTTLLPGDLICTGTPAGVAFGSDPPGWLQPGSTVAVEIEGVGTLTNPVIAASTPSTVSR